VEVAAVIAVPPAVIYVAGLVAFWVQLSNDYGSHGLEHTWMAASLVARTTAAGLGAEIVLRGLVGALALATVLLFGAYIILRLRTGLQDHSDSEVPRVSPLGVPIATAFVGGMMFLILWTQATEGPSVSIIRISGALVVFYFLQFYLYWSIGGAVRSKITKPIAFYPMWLYSLIVVLGIICLGGAVLFPGEASLPCLYRGTAEGDVMDGEVLSAKQAEEVEGLESLEGGFLGHSEGYWYVIDNESLDLEAIPDDEAKRDLEGEFYVGYTRIEPNGEPVGEPMTEEEADNDSKPALGYELSGECGPPPR
jgi:hypothetical protein